MCLLTKKNEIHRRMNKYFFRYIQSIKLEDYYQAVSDITILDTDFLKEMCQYFSEVIVILYFYNKTTNEYEIIQEFRVCNEKEIEDIRDFVYNFDRNGGRFSYFHLFYIRDYRFVAVTDESLFYSVLYYHKEMLNTPCMQMLSDYFTFEQSK